VHYLDFLAGLHERLAPPAYLEIGVRHGDSLVLSRGPAVGIDPAFELEVELSADVALFRETSDEYFDRDEPLAPFAGEPIALAFIDGMHLGEFVVRDLANVERLADWSSVVVFDDILPRSADEATRDRRTRVWTGDVYKLLGVLADHRPDLICLRVDTEPTGLGVVLGLDPLDNTLRERYDAIARAAAVPDPQPLPDEIAERAGALDPRAVLDSSIWPLLRAARERGTSRRRGIHALRRAVRRDLGVSVPRVRLVDLASA
jgi:methyltransferase family protein